MAIKFNIDYIKKNTGMAVFLRAKRIYENSQLQMENFEKTKVNLQQINLKFFFKVASDTRENKKYEIIISFDFTRHEIQKIKNHCECIFFQLHQNTCKHSAAALLHLVKQSTNLLAWTDNLGPTRELLEFFKANNIITSSKKIINCEINLKIKNLEKAILKLKIGCEKLYTVQEIVTLVNTFSNPNINDYYQRKFFMNFKFNFNHNEYKLSKKLKKIINFLIAELEIININNYNSWNNNNIFYHSNSRKNNEFELIPSQTERLLKALKGEQLELDFESVNSYHNIVISNQIYTPNLTILQEDKQIVIKNLNENPFFLTVNAKSIFDKKQILFLSNDNKSANTILFTMALSNQQQLSFDNTLTNEVLTYIIPNLTKQDNITIAPEITGNIINEDLIIESYFDFDGEEIILKPLYKYGEFTFDINNQTAIVNNKIVKRNDNLETKYLDFIHNLKFYQEENEFKLANLDAIIELLTNLPKLETYSTIFYSERFKNVKLIKFKIKTAGVSINEDNQLLEFNFKLDEINPEELQEILMATKSPQKYYKLKNGGIIDLQNKSLKKFTNLFEKLDLPVQQYKQEKFSLPKHQALFLEHQLASFKNLKLEKNKIFSDLITKIKNINSTNFEVSAILKPIMREYQTKGHQWLKTLATLNFGGILADEMGLGKTLQTISYINSEYEHNQAMKPVLIIGPASIIYNWKNEIARFAPQLKTIVITGTKQERLKILQNYQDYQVLITSYPLLRRDFLDFEQLKFSHCFIDEAQHIKNPLSLNAKATKDINAEIKFALTGTPIENNLSELWSIFDFVLPGFLLSHHKFKKQYEAPIIKDKNNELLQELMKKTQPFILRRLKKEVALELPDKIENKTIIEMTFRQHKIYGAYITTAKKDIDLSIKTNGFNNSKIKILAVLTRLRQICCDPSIIDEKFQNESGKINALKDILEELIGFKHKILIFSQFTKVLKKIEPLLNNLKINFLYLDGKTPTKDRVNLTNEFNENANISVFLISLKAGGVGLNLTAADVVIHFDPWWNPSIENQATDRAHRIGQKKVVQVIKLITKGTIEEKIITIQEKKQHMINSILDSSNEQQLITNLTETELRSILDLE